MFGFWECVSSQGGLAPKGAVHTGREGAVVCSYQDRNRYTGYSTSALVRYTHTTRHITREGIMRHGAITQRTRFWGQRALNEHTGASKAQRAGYRFRFVRSVIQAVTRGAAISRDAQHVAWIALTLAFTALVPMLVLIAQPDGAQTPVVEAKNADEEAVL